MAVVLDRQLQQRARTRPGWCVRPCSAAEALGTDLDGPDYPSNTVPNKVEHLFMAQLFHDRRNREARLRMTPEQRKKTPSVDYLRPIVAVSPFI